MEAQSRLRRLGRRERLVVLLVLFFTAFQAGAQLTIGGAGRCLQFSKPGDYGRVESLPGLQAARGFTLEFWGWSLSPTQTFSIFSVTTPARVRFGWTGSEGLICFSKLFFFTDSSSNVTLFENNFDFDSWNHFAFVADAITGQCVLLVNGQPAAQAFVPPAETSNISFESSSLTFGQLEQDQDLSFDPAYSFRGMIDEVRLWKAARSPEVIQSGMKLSGTSNSLIAIDPQLVTIWSFDSFAFLSEESLLADQPALVSDIFNTTNIKLGCLINHKTKAPCQTLPAVVRSSSPIAGPGTAVIVSTDKWTDINVNLRFWQVGYQIPEFRLISLPRFGSVYFVNNGTRGAEITVEGTVLPRPEVIYRPNPLLFGDSGDSFVYDAGYPASPRFPAPVIIDKIAAPVSKDSSFAVLTNEIKYVALLCDDWSGDSVVAEITSLPTTGLLFQVQPFMGLNTSLGPALGPPISSAGVKVSHPANLLAFVPPDNFMTSTSTDFNFYCKNSGQTPSDTATVSLQLVPARPRPLVGAGQHVLQFDGIRSVAHATITNASISSIKTIELWVKLFSSSAHVRRAEQSPVRPDRQVLVQAMYDMVGQYSFVIFADHFNGSFYRLGLGNHNASAAYLEQLAAPALLIPTDTWVHVAVSVQEPLATFYINSARVGTSVTIGPISDIKRIQLGALLTQIQGAPTLSKFFLGMLDDVRFWTTVQDTPELTVNMRSAPAALTSSSMAYYWDFNEGWGNTTVDRVSFNQLQLGRDDAWDMPRWMVSDRPQLSTILTRENDVGIAFLQASSVGNTDPFTFAVVELPRLGSLYQYNASTHSLGSPITAAYVDWAVPQPIEQWVASVVSWSSYLNSPGNVSMHHPFNLIGPPYEWAKDEGISSPSDPILHSMSPTVNASQASPTSSWSIWPIPSDTLSSIWTKAEASGKLWIPGAACNLSSSTNEFVEVSFRSPVFPQKVDIYENALPEAISNVWAWDKLSSNWKLLYKTPPADVDYLSTPPSRDDPSPLSVFSPPFCESTIQTDRLRIELNPCMSARWQGIAAVKLVGTVAPREGIVLDPSARVVYVPPSYASGDDLDSFVYAAFECPFNMARATAPVRYSIDVAPRNNAPLASSLLLSAAEGLDVTIQLKGFDPDGDKMVFVVTSLPSNGLLYQVTNTSEKGDVILDPPVVVVNSQGLLMWSPPRNGLTSCGLAFSNFTYFVTDVASSSNESSVVIDVNCTPGAYSIASGIVYTSWGVAAALLIFGVVLLILAIIFKQHKSVRKSQPALLIIMLIGAITCYASVFMFSTRINDAICHVRVWSLNIGITLILGTLVVKMYHIWRTFSAKMFRRNTELTPRHTAIFLTVLVVIELAQLLVYSIVAAPFLQEEIDSTNAAIRHQSCQSAIPFTPMYLFIYKGVLVVMGTCIYTLIRSVTKTKFKPESLELLIFSVYGLFISGGVAVPILLIVKNRDALFLLGCISIAAPVTVTLLLMLIPKVRSVLQKELEKTDDPIEQFTMRAMSSSPTNASTGGSPRKSARGKAAQAKDPKGKGKKVNRPVDPTQNLMELSKYSEDKSVLELLEAIQGKDSEISALKSKMVKQQYKLQTLKQRLMSSEGGKRGIVTDDDDFDFQL